MGCFSERNVKVNYSNNKSDTNIKKKSTYNKSYTKSFQYGEIYYIKHRELEAMKNQIVGGSERVEIYLSIKDEKEGHRKLDYDIIISNLKIEVLISSALNKDIYTCLGSTEVLEEDSLKYQTTFIVDYFFEKHQYLQFNTILNEQRQDSVKTTIGKIFGARDHSVSFPLNIHNEQGLSLLISIHAIKEEVTNSLINFSITINMSQEGYYFIIISNSNAKDKKWQKVYKSIEKQGKDNIYIVNDLKYNDVCLGDDKQDILFEILDVNKGIIGNVLTNLNTLKYTSNNIPIINEGKNGGTCQIIFNTEKQIKFINYLENGLQISALFGIDFTASNEDAKLPHSHHYIYGKESNPYEQAIRSCGSVVAFYDYDQIFPLYGFGAILPSTTVTNHCFNCTLSPDPNVNGIEGVIQIYKNCLITVRLDGPTYFAPLIKNMNDFVRGEINKNDYSVYYIMLILTDGCIHDFENTKDAIYESAQLPISIIIIGIGGSSEDFGLMEELDGDEVPLTNKKGQKIERDIVQFVVFNKFKGDMTRLAAEVLYEIPVQVEQYYKKYKNFRGYNSK